MRFRDLALKFCILLLLTTAVNSAEAQKRKVLKAPPLAPTTEKEPLEVPGIKDFAFLVDIDENAEVTLNVRKLESSNLLADSVTQQPLTDFFTAFANLQNKKTSNATKNSLNPITIINADQSLYFRDIVKVIQALRVSPSQKIKLKIAENLYVLIPAKIADNEREILKPNPNTLIVFLAKDNKIRLNQDEMGDVTNTSLLKETLKRIFKQRAEYGIMREGTNETEQTVFVNAPLSLRFSELSNLVKAVAEAGAMPIGLQVDDLEQ